MSTLIIASVLLFMYLVLCNRLSALVQPLRIEMAEIGEKLIADGRIDRRVRSKISYQIETVLDGWRAWFVVFLVPVAAVLYVFDVVTGRPLPSVKVPDDVRVDYARFYRLATVCRFANSPIAAVLFMIEMSALLVVLLPVMQISNLVDALLNRFDRNNPFNSKGHKPV